MPTVLSNSRIRAALILAAGLAIAGCTPHPTAQSSAGTDGPKMLDDATVTKPGATVGPAKAATTQPSNNNVTGAVTFTLAGDHLTFVADIDGLAPNTKHGFHIHEKGDL